MAGAERRVSSGMEEHLATPPTNSLVTPLLTDLYQVTMAYAYWKAGKQDSRAAFDLFFRKNPFGGEFAIFAGGDEVLRFLSSFRFDAAAIGYIRSLLSAADCDERFFDYLATLDCRRVKVQAIAEGTVVFPRVPLLRVEGPLLVTQLLETTLLCLVNFPSLMATNAARHRMAAGASKTLLEFGLRRAQGPDGGVSASRYSYVGGFDGTSNVAAGSLFGIPVKGTHAHSFVSSFVSFDEISDHSLIDLVTGERGDFVAEVLAASKAIEANEVVVLAAGGRAANRSELAAFTAYALAFPKGFLALVDTYDVCKSGVVNFCAVSLALGKFGYTPLGVRLDSGDLAYLSREVRGLFKTMDSEFPGGLAGGRTFASLQIVASNDIHEDILYSLNDQRHDIDAFGIGTHLVTCLKQPALGCVYKLVEIDGQPRIKLSEDVEKVTIPSRKRAYRLYGREGYALLDLLMGDGEPPPVPNQRILCRHPFSESKRAFVVPTRVEPLYEDVWTDGGLATPLPARPDLEAARRACRDSLASMRPDHLRHLNPTPYKVSVSDRLYNFIHTLWLSEAPVGELS